jgi:methanogenic corrinoid protein MtbC1
MVETEIIPRLLLAHRLASDSPPPPMPTDGAVGLGAETTEAFARMVLSKEPDSLIVFVGGLLQSGVALESIYVDLLAPAARRLGEYWDEDSATFTDVTIGLGRLQQVMRILGRRLPTGGDNDHASRSALFSPCVGEQHTFGLFIIEDFFRRSGWRTWVETSAKNNEAVDTIGCHWFDVFGLSVACDTEIKDISAMIRSVRKASRNKDLFVMVGGRFFVEKPELATQVGADATASNGGEALTLADLAVRRLASG